jgi:hypothetical protein
MRIRVTLLLLASTIVILIGQAGRELIPLHDFGVSDIRRTRDLGRLRSIHEKNRGKR